MSRDELIASGFGILEEPDSFIEMVGPIFVRYADGRAQTRLILERKHLNPVGTAHGGLLVTLLDITLGCNAGAAIGHRGTYPTVQLNANFMAGASLGEIISGEAIVERVTRTLAFVTGRLVVGDRAIATATAVFRNPPPPKA